MINQKDKDIRTHAILIGAGENSGKMAEAIKDNLSRGSYVMALDGGLAFCAEHGIQPDIIVGDFDSLPDMSAGAFDSLPEMLAEDFNPLSDMTAETAALGKKVEPILLSKYPQEIIYKLPCEKDDTDTLAAIKMAVEKGFTDFTIYGGLGGRLSHTMANIQSLFYLKEQGLYGELVGDGSRIFLIKDECITIETREKSYLSVFSFSGKAEGVTIKNLKYEIKNVELLNSFPIGVSNEFVGKQAVISVRKGTLLVIVEDM